MGLARPLQLQAQEGNMFSGSILTDAAAAHSVQRGTAIDSDSEKIEKRNATPSESPSGVIQQATDVVKKRESPATVALNESKGEFETKTRRELDDVQAEYDKVKRWQTDSATLLRILNEDNRTSTYYNATDIVHLRERCLNSSPEALAAFQRTMDDTDLRRRLVGILNDTSGQGCHPNDVGKIHVSTLELRTVEFNDKAKDLEKRITDLRRQLEDAGAPVPQASSNARLPVSSQPSTATADTRQPEDATPNQSAEAGEAARPKPSSKEGLEGAAENAARISQWAETELLRLSAAYNSEKDGAKQSEIKTRIDALGRQMQAISSMQAQFETMLSTILKLRSDMAMTAIRNMR